MNSDEIMKLVDKEIDFFRTLYSKYKSDIALKYDLSLEDLESIIYEGARLYWPKNL